MARGTPKGIRRRVVRGDRVITVTISKKGGHKRQYGSTMAPRRRKTVETRSVTRPRKFGRGITNWATRTTEREYVVQPAVNEENKIKGRGGTRVCNSVHMDLSGPYPESTMQNRYVLHMVDAQSSFCVVAAIPDIKKEVLASAFLHFWVSYWGWPATLYNDNRGEYMKELSDALGVLALHGKFAIGPGGNRAKGYAESNVNDFKRWLKRMHRKEGKGELENDVMWDIAKDWDTKLAGFKGERNNKKETGTGRSPLEGVMNRNHSEGTSSSIK